MIFLGDWLGSQKELQEASAEAHEVEKMLSKAGFAVHRVHENIDAFVEKILTIQKEKKNLRVIHYAGHVEHGGLAAGKDEFLASGFLKDAYGLSFSSEPIVFLNGCCSGEVLDVWNKYRNLATEFLACGASTCVVTDFPVPETSSRNFARLFYQHLVGSSRSVGESLRRTRVEISQLNYSGNGDPAYDITRFFYNLYGNPITKL